MNYKQKITIKNVIPELGCPPRRPLRAALDDTIYRYYS